MSIEYLKPTNSSNIDINRLTQSAEKTGKPSGGKKAEGSTEDKLSISSEARNLQHTDMVVKTALSEMPEIREDKLQAVRERMASGDYFSKDGLEDTADSLISQFSKASRRAEESTMKVLLNKMDEEPEIRQNQVQDAAAKKAVGFYNSDESIKQTGERLWIPPVYRR